MGEVEGVWMKDWELCVVEGGGIRTSEQNSFNAHNYLDFLHSSVRPAPGEISVYPPSLCLTAICMRNLRNGASGSQNQTSSPKEVNT